MSLLDLMPLERPILWFDTETTGPNPREDRIVELGFIQVKPDGTRKEWQTFINPGVPIPKEATFGNGTDDYPGHGITDEMVQGCRTCGRTCIEHGDEKTAGCPVCGNLSVEVDCGHCHCFIPWPTFGQLAQNLLIGFSNTDFGGFNVKRFDLPLMQSEFARHGHAWEFHEAHILDGFRIWQLGSKRTLSDAVELFLQRKHAGAHRALDDVRESMDVVVAQLKLFTSLPRNLKALHEKCWPKDPNAIDPDGKIIWKDGEAVMNFGKNWMGVPLKMMPRKDLQWIVSPKCQGASISVKRICDEALAGRFPETTLKEIVE